MTWQNEVVLDRSVGRQPKRPGLALVIPLTEPMMAHGAVPPLLALFNDRLFPNFHIGDGIEVAIETARHPFPLIARLKHEMATVEEAIRVFPPPQDEDQEAEKQRLVDRLAELTARHDSIKPHTLPALKFLQEQGPDGIRTGESADGTILPLRLDGPIGYTFDLKTEAGRFDHAGILITPVHQELTPWSMVKLRFRRHEAPEGLDPTMELTKDGAAPNSGGRPSELHPLKPGEAVHYRLANNRGLTGIAPSRAEIVFPTEHEGLIVDIPETTDLGSGSKVRISFVGEIKVPGPTPPLDQHYVEVACNRDLANGLLTLSFLTDLGDAGEWTVPVKDGTTVTIRLVLSARDKPETGNKFEPAGDVAVHVRLTRSDAIDAIDKPEENRWLAVACIPLISTRVIGVDDPFVVEVLPTLPAQAGAIIAPVRLSTFTPGLWCQFAEAMSLFNATFANGEKAIIAASDLSVTITGTIATVAAGGGGLCTLAAIVPPETETDESQIEELLVAVVTRYVRDVFDRLRERPVAVKLWDPDTVTLDLSSPDWPPRPKKKGAIVPLVADDLGTTGRLRFLKILRAKTRERGGFLDEEAVFPQDFFEPGMLGVATDMNPPDAKGLILGTSMPIEWTRKT
jgi:hypothetical protein